MSLKRLSIIFRDAGLKGVFASSLKKLIRPVVQLGGLVFIECDLSKALREVRPVDGIVAREAFESDLNLFIDPENPSLARDVVLSRFKAGNRCFIGVDQFTGKLANYRWVTQAPEYIAEVDRYLMLKPGELYIYDLHTLPAFRKRGVDAYTRHFAYNYLKNTGFTKIFAYVRADNVPSLKASRLLLQEVGRVWYLQFRFFKPVLIGKRNPALPELQKPPIRSAVGAERSVIQVAKRR